MPVEPDNGARPTWKERVHEVIFEADTSGGKLFDVVLLVAILLSIIIVMLESVEAYDDDYGELFWAIELVLTSLFTLEYLLRLWSVGRARAYALSFYGVVDLLAIVPFYLSLLVAGTQSLLVIRALRLLRVFRVLKLAPWLAEVNTLAVALRESRRKVFVFLATVITLVVILGALMYLIEGKASGFDNIPVSIYWAIVTMTTVGYGDIAPATVPGQFLASCIMIAGYGIIAVPTGIVSVELARASSKDTVTTTACRACMRHGHDPDAVHCKYCGEKL